MIHLYSGNGKGKSTAAFGLALRQLGYGRKILIVQFLKDGASGELKALKQFRDVRIYTREMPEKFYDYMDIQEQEITKGLQQDLWMVVEEQIASYDCIILDEIVDALHMHLLDADQVYEVLKKHCGEVEFVLTGRNPSIALQELSDYYTEFKLHKHPFEKGVSARVGIEY